MKKKVWVTLAAVLFLTGCTAGGNKSQGAGNTASGDTIKIGLNMELSGAVSAYGNQEKDGAELAIKEINDAGGVLDKKLELVVKDNKSDSAEAASVSANLTSNGVVAIVGPATSGATKATMPSITKAQVPIITPSATDDAITVQNGKVQDFVFRSCFQDSSQGSIMAKFAADNLKKTKAIILGDNSNDYATGLAKAFKDAFTGTIVDEQNFTADDKDFQAVLTKIKAEDFDAIYVPGYYAQAGQIIKQAREMGIDQTILGADGFSDPALIDLASKDNVTNVYYTNHFSVKAPATDSAAEFLTNFKEAYDAEPSAFNALTYDAVYMIKQAIEDAGTANSVKIKDALAKLKDFEGVTGVMTMDENHNPKKDIVVIGLTNGEESSAETVSPE